MSPLLVGTSGWSYPSWRPRFYPGDARPEDFLRLYAERLSAVELNSTGYRLPPLDQFRRWAEQVPDGFRFAVKAPPSDSRRIEALTARALALGDRLGCVRVVVEKPRDEGLVELLLGSIDPTVRLAFDLRDPSWDGIEPRLAAAGAVRVGDLVTPSSWRYARFRDPPYSEAEIEASAASLQPALAAGVDVFAFFRHEELPTAPAYAERLRALCSA